MSKQKTINYDSVEETQKHISRVQSLMGLMITELFLNAGMHDESKINSMEKEYFDKYTPKLAGCTYGSEEYKQFLKELKPALDHHYEENRHHPEHYTKYVCNGCFTEYKKEYPSVCPGCGYSQFQKEEDISQMTLIDLIEMLCDWKAATERHKDGDIIKSLEINKNRFLISQQLSSILYNTVEYFKYTKIWNIQPKEQ